MMRKASLALIILCATLFSLGRSPGIPVQQLTHTLIPTQRPSDTQLTTTATQQRPRPTLTQKPQIIVVASKPTLPPRLTLTRQWLYYPAGDVAVPILLYHHVAKTEKPSRYIVSPEDFAAQISSLHNWGYTAIPLSLLVEAMLNGAELPPHPVVITFDDGYRDVYQNALPVMQRYGYVATIYIIADQVGVGGYLNARQIAELVEQQ